MRPSRTREERKIQGQVMTETELKAELEQQADLKRKQKALALIKEKEEILKHYENYKLGENVDNNNEELGNFLVQKRQEIEAMNKQLEQRDPEFYMQMKLKEVKELEKNEGRQIKRKEKAELNDNFFQAQEDKQGNMKVLTKGEIEREKRLKLREEERLRRVAGIYDSAYDKGSIGSNTAINPTDNNNNGIDLPINQKAQNFAFKLEANVERDMREIIENSKKNQGLDFNQQQNLTKEATKIRIFSDAGGEIPHSPTHIISREVIANDTMKFEKKPIEFESQSKNIPGSSNMINQDNYNKVFQANNNLDENQNPYSLNHQRPISTVVTKTEENNRQENLRKIFDPAQEKLEKQRKYKQELDEQMRVKRQNSAKVGSRDDRNNPFYNKEDFQARNDRDHTYQVNNFVNSREKANGIRSTYNNNNESLDNGIVNTSISRIKGAFDKPSQIPNNNNEYDRNKQYTQELIKKNMQNDKIQGYSYPIEINNTKSLDNRDGFKDKMGYYDQSYKEQQGNETWGGLQQDINRKNIQGNVQIDNKISEYEKKKKYREELEEQIQAKKRMSALNKQVENGLANRRETPKVVDDYYSKNIEDLSLKGNNHQEEINRDNSSSNIGNKVYQSTTLNAVTENQNSMKDGLFSKGDDEIKMKKLKQEQEKQKLAEELRKQMEEKNERKRLEKLKKEEEDLKERKRLEQEIKEMERIEKEKELQKKQARNDFFQQSHPDPQQDNTLKGIGAHNLKNIKVDSNQNLNLETNQDKNIFQDMNAEQKSDAQINDNEGYMKPHPQRDIGLRNNLYGNLDPEPIMINSYPYQSPKLSNQLDMGQYAQRIEEERLRKERQELEQRLNLEKIALEERLKLEQFKNKINEVKLEKFHFDKEIERLRMLLETSNIHGGSQLLQEALRNNNHLLNQPLNIGAPSPFGNLQLMQQQQFLAYLYSMLLNTNPLLPLQLPFPGFVPNQQNLLDPFRSLAGNPEPKIKESTPFYPSVNEGFNHMNNNNNNYNPSIILDKNQSGIYYGNIKESEILRQSLPSSSNYLVNIAESMIQQSFVKDLEAFKQLNQNKFMQNETNNPINYELPAPIYAQDDLNPQFEPPPRLPSDISPLINGLKTIDENDVPNLYQGFKESQLVNIYNNNNNNTPLPFQQNTFSLKEPDNINGIQPLILPDEPKKNEGQVTETGKFAISLYSGGINVEDNNDHKVLNGNIPDIDVNEQINEVTKDDDDDKLIAMSGNNDFMQNRVVIKYDSYARYTHNNNNDQVDEIGGLDSNISDYQMKLKEQLDLAKEDVNKSENEMNPTNQPKKFEGFEPQLIPNNITLSMGTIDSQQNYTRRSSKGFVIKQKSGGVSDKVLSSLAKKSNNYLAEPTDDDNHLFDIKTNPKKESEGEYLRNSNELSNISEQAWDNKGIMVNSTNSNDSNISLLKKLGLKKSNQFMNNEDSNNILSNNLILEKKWSVDDDNNNQLIYLKSQGSKRQNSLIQLNQLQDNNKNNNSNTPKLPALPSRNNSAKVRQTKTNVVDVPLPSIHSKSPYGRGYDQKTVANPKNYTEADNNFSNILNQAGQNSSKHRKPKIIDPFFKLNSSASGNNLNNDNSNENRHSVLDDEIYTQNKPRSSYRIASAKEPSQGGPMNKYPNQMKSFNLQYEDNSAIGNITDPFIPVKSSISANLRQANINNMLPPKSKNHSIIAQEMLRDREDQRLDSKGIRDDALLRRFDKLMENIEVENTANKSSMKIDRVPSAKNEYNSRKDNRPESRELLFKPLSNSKSYSTRYLVPLDPKSSI